MPAKNIIKEYIENGYYHIYNRGVEKRTIFLDEQDCKVLLHYQKLYLSPLKDLPKIIEQFPDKRLNRFFLNNLSEEVDLISFSLMPNHIHLLIRQKTKNGIIKFMRRLITSYVMYFNRKYKRVGTLFQNTYKAALVNSDEYLLHLTRYIHLNPLSIKTEISFKEYSSYPYYLGKKQASWLKPEIILSNFRSAKKDNQKDILSYQSFVEDSDIDETINLLGDLRLEDDPLPR